MCKIQIPEIGATRKWIILLHAIAIPGMNPVINTNKPRIIATPEEANNKTALITNLKAGPEIVRSDKTGMMIMATGNLNKGITMTVTNRIGEINTAKIKGPAMVIMKPVIGMIAMKGIGAVKPTRDPVVGIKMTGTGMI